MVHTKSIPSTRPVANDAEIVDNAGLQRGDGAARSHTGMPAVQFSRLGRTKGGGSGERRNQMTA